MKKWIAAALALILVLAAIYLGSPIYAARSLQKAAIAGDLDRIKAGVDFPAVRESLEPQLSAATTARIQADPRMGENPYVAMGMMLLPSLVKGAVDTLVTPKGIAALMRGRGPSGRDKDKANPDIDRNAEYVGLDRFRVRLRDTRRNADGPAFLFERRGFASWKLVAVELPTGWLAEESPR